MKYMTYLIKYAGGSKDSFTINEKDYEAMLKDVQSKGGKVCGIYECEAAPKRIGQSERYNKFDNISETEKLILKS